MIGAAPIFAALTLVAAVSPAAAADRPGRALFEQAETKFNLGRFDEALADYQAAYEVEPLPAFLFNIAQCYRNMGNYERAQFFFHRYVALDPRSPNRPAAERLILEMDRLVAAQAADDSRQVVATKPSLAATEPPPAGTGERNAGAIAFGPVVEQRGNQTAPRPVYRRPWLWIGVAAVVVGGVAAVYAVSRDDSHPSLGTIDIR